nr:hypothetical protein Iba_chr02aCG19080 [Ipomoea batatas]
MPFLDMDQKILTLLLSLHTIMGLTNMILDLVLAILGLLLRMLRRLWIS